MREIIKQLSKQYKRNIGDLLALSRQNDPFYVGSEDQVRKAKWFTEVFEQVGVRPVHLRRLHYWAVSQEIAGPNGMAYENTEKCWKSLIDAGKYARYLGFIPMYQIIDRRNPMPYVAAIYPDEDDIEYDPYIVDFQMLVPDENVDLDFYYRSFEDFIEGMADYGSNFLIDSISWDVQKLQPYHLEIWVEKSTMNDIIHPIAQSYSANVVSGLGELSISRVNELIGRIVKDAGGKPTRLFYISDFDPKGAHMPVSVSRKLEWFCRNKYPNLDIKLKQIALTDEQCLSYQLPRIPIKDSDNSKKGFEKKHGSGATELDALEAIHPGELGTIITDNLDPYYDETLQIKIYQEKSNGKETLYRIIHEALMDETLENKVNDVINLSNDVSDEIKRLKKPLIDKVTELNDILNSIDIDLNIDIKKPVAEPIDDTDEEWLFDCALDYMEQLERYKEN